MPPRIQKHIAVAAGIIGIVQAIFGFGLLISCFILSGVSRSAIAPYWGAIPMIISGGIAIGIWPTRNQCLLIATLVINIILVILLGIAAALTALASAIYALYMRYLDESTTGCVDSGNDCHCDSHVINNVKCDDLHTINALLKCFVAFTILGMIVSLALSIVGCMGICCYKGENGSASVGSNGQVVIVTQGQPGLPPNPPPYDNQQKHDGMITYQPPTAY